MEAAYDNRGQIRDMVVDMVSTYHPELAGGRADREAEPAAAAAVS